MKRNNKHFISELKQRFSPSINCYVTRNLISSCEDVYEKIEKVWKSVISEKRLKIRLKFIEKLTDSRKLDILTQDYHKIYNVEPYSFTSEAYSFNEDEKYEELVSTLFVKQMFINQEYIFSPSYFDVPLTRVVFLKDKVDFEFPNVFYHQGLVSWIKEIEVEKYTIDVDDNTLKQELENIYDFSRAKFDCLFSRSLEYFMQKVKTKLGDIFSKNTAKRVHNHNIKVYADFLMMQGEYNEALDVYKKISSSFPDIHASAIFLSSLCELFDLMAHENEYYIENRHNDYFSDHSDEDLDQIEEIVKRIGKCRQFSLDYNDFMINCFTDHSIRCFYRLSDLEDPMISCIQKVREDKRDLFLVPFFMEQNSFHFSKRMAQLSLYIVFRNYMEFNRFEFALNCLWKCLSIGFYGFDALSHFIGENIVYTFHNTSKQYPSIRDLLDNVIFDIVKSRIIHVPDLFVQVINNVSHTDGMICGFISPIVYDLRYDKFVNSPPQSYQHNRLSFARMYFSSESFYLEQSDVFDCAVGEYIYISIYIHSGFKEFNLENFFISGTQFTCSKIRMDFKFAAWTEVRILPSVPGPFEISHVEFDWNGIHFKVPFPHKPIRFYAYADVPDIKVEVLTKLPSVICVNEIIFYKIRIKILSSEPVAHLSSNSICNGDCDVTLLSPANDDLTQLASGLKENDALELEYLISPKIIGSCRVELLLKYWCKEGPKRYSCTTVGFESNHSQHKLNETPKGLSITYPINSKILGFKSESKSLQLFMEIGRSYSKFDYVSFHKQSKESCDSIPSFFDEWFKNTPTYICWFNNNIYGMSEVVIRHKIGIFISCESNTYTYSLYNISCSPVKNIRFIVTNKDDDKLSVIITGKNVLIHDIIMPDEHLQMSNTIHFLTGDKHVKFLLQYDDKEYDRLVNMSA